MKDELLKLQQEMKELRELFDSALKHEPLNEDTLKRIFEEYFRNKEMLAELRFIRFSVVVAIIIATLGLVLMMWLAE